MKTVGLIRRGIAASVDGMFGIGAVTIGFITGVFERSLFNPEPGWFWTEWLLKHWLDAPELFIRPVVAAIAIAVCWTVAWELAFQRSPGARVAGIEVVDVDEYPPHPGRTCVRAIGLALNAATLGFLWIWGLVAPSRRTLHDLMSGTYVSRTDR